MRLDLLANTKHLLAALVLFTTLGVSATEPNRATSRVVLLKPFVHASIAELSPGLADKYAELARIDPEHPFADLADESASQTLSMFGREDLIADISDDYKSTRCAPLGTASDVFTEIEADARNTSIVIVNESHERSDHRGFIAEVARRLRPLGYDTLAIETLSNPVSGTPNKYLPTFIRQPGLPYFVDEDGFYLSEAGFGRLGRLAKSLGYRFLSYEPNEEIASAQNMKPDERTAVREEGQARNLASFLRDHPGAKLLVHVGYSHAAEASRISGARLMAARLKEKTGIDPLTISQTTCRGGGDTLRLSALPPSEPAGTFDLVVDHPAARFERHRPEWRKLAGDRLVSIPRQLYPATGWRVIEARPVGEPATSVPMDRVAIRHGENVALMLPPGRYNLQIIDPTVVGRKLSEPTN